MSFEAVTLHDSATGTALGTLDIMPNNDTLNRGPQLPDDLIIHPKGEFVAAGTTSFVERLPSGDILKTPLAGDVREKDCRNEIAVEARVYQVLGEHPRLVKLKGWDSVTHTLTLEYMPNGTLEEYVKSYHMQISQAQIFRWIAQAAEGLQLLHSAGVIHCDVGPHNFLLDADMSLKIIDFSGSSLDGSRAMVCPGARYAAPDPDWKPGKPPTVEEDLFGLGSTIYYIVTGKVPFDELPDEEVEKKYLGREFPDLADVLYGEIIRLCWHQEACSAQIIREIVDN
ncbi:G-type lectin S-receptor-like serine/threonine-protein kinase [Lachnellula willkommii]|uniref:G-type lectin S-receptor-like serine/threonine-protein kinase n=1 Tax=Lachnellula willkommii TaxID=215461 RepID=A0A559M585_9HELO|nr:G-type lectin S-receptor-like serine/threonine-protein kinase [Lachnellula willkommii]